MIYAVGDIHGMFDKLKTLHNKIIADIAYHGGTHATIVFLGDYVDHGPKPAEVLDFLMGLKNTDKLTYIVLKGNHEDMMVNNYYRNGHCDMWVTNGGRETLDAFGCVTILDFYNNRQFKDYMIWCEALPTLHVMGRYVFVHGGYNPKLPPEEQNPDLLMWKRDNTYNWMQYKECEFVVVHGHTPHVEPQVFTNEINVDTYAWRDGKLTAVCLPQDIADYTAEELNAMTTEQVNIIINEKIRFLTA